MDLNVDKVLRPDAKGRITLGNLAKGISGFKIRQDDQGRIILEPYTEIPNREKWLFENAEALDKIKKGVIDSSTGNVAKKGSFAAFIHEE